MWFPRGEVFAFLRAVFAVLLGVVVGICVRAPNGRAAATLRALHVLSPRTEGDGSQTREVLFPDASALELFLQIIRPAALPSSASVFDERLLRQSRHELSARVVYRRAPDPEAVVVATKRNLKRSWGRNVAEGEIDPVWQLFVSMETQSRLREAGLSVHWHGLTPVGWHIQ